MITFKQYLNENTSPMTGKQLEGAIGKRALRSMLSHPYWKDRMAHYSDHIFTHTKTPAGDHEVDSYPYEKHMVKNGRLHSPHFVRFQFNKHKVDNAHLFVQRAKGEEGPRYTYVKSHK